jgi:para-nitrobenzyl esterase
VAARELRPTPLLAGVTRDEGTLFTDLFFDRADGPLTADRFDDLLTDVAGRRAAEARRAYPLDGRSPGRAWAEVITDRAYACPALATWRGVGGRAPLFAYEFADRTAPSAFTALPPDLAGGATHGAEMPYLFDLVPGQPELDPAQRDLADSVVRAWARFATTGDPNGEGAPRWPRWSGDGAILTLTGATDPVPVTGTDFAAAHHCDLWPS